MERIVNHWRHPNKFLELQEFVKFLTRTCQRSVSEAKRFRSSMSHTISLCYILIIFSVIILRFPSSLFPCCFLNIFNPKVFSPMPMPVAERSKAWACLLRLRVRIPPGAWMYVSCECCVLSGRGLCEGLIPRTEESYRLWCVWVWSGKTITHWTFSEKVEDIRLRHKTQ